ncbi:hypothetical protein [Kocuria rhizophila]|uniref:hypothetical protein n=1 Tax=Kocuria rhizophila TaxID=72000 RepID=UPI001642BCCB|nr:hypothetical protein [Kocuria rhizophila]
MVGWRRWKSWKGWGWGVWAVVGAGGEGVWRERVDGGELLRGGVGVVAEGGLVEEVVEWGKMKKGWRVTEG